MFHVTLCSAGHDRPKLDKLSRAAVSDTPRLDKAVRSQSDSESSDTDDDDDDDDEGFAATGNESGVPTEAAVASISLTVS